MNYIWYFTAAFEKFLKYDNDIPFYKNIAMQNRYAKVFASISSVLSSLSSSLGITSNQLMTQINASGPNGAFIILFGDILQQLTTSEDIFSNTLRGFIMALSESSPTDQLLFAVREKLLNELWIYYDDIRDYETRQNK